MKKSEINILRVGKKTLFIIAGLIWGFAGFRVFSLGREDVMASNTNLLISFLLASVVFFVFFKFIFSKMSRKHKKRIINSELEKHCVFSFFDFKSYIIMGVMIFGGITIRNLHIINPAWLGTFYMGLGVALFSAGISFLISFFKFEKAQLIYKN